MADSKVTPITAAGSNNFKEAVCIDAGRIYDSCSDKDCVEGVEVFFTDSGQAVIEQANSVKCKSIEVLNVLLDVEPVLFNRGFYSVDMTFFFCVKLETYTSPLASCVNVTGLAVHNKKVILYGSEGNVRTFCSTDRYAMGSMPAEELCKTNLPRACLQVVDPMCLSCQLIDCQPRCVCVPPPQCVADYFEGNFTAGSRPNKTVCITLGLFTIVHLERNVQIMIPAYDYCVPDKESVTSGDDPCELFRKIKFPTAEFFPPRMADVSEDCD